jgi:hypothetical protein
MQALLVHALRRNERGALVLSGRDSVTNLSQLWPRTQGRKRRA